MRLIVNSRTVTERISKISHNSPLALQLQLEFECALRLRVREFESRFCCKFLSHYCAALSEAQANAGVVDAGLLLVGIRRRRRPRTGHSQRQRQRQASAAQMPSAKRQSAGAWRQQQQPQPQNITGRQSDRCNSTSNILGSCCPPRVPHRACSFTLTFSHSFGQRIRCAAHCLLGYVPPVCSESLPALSFSRHKQSFKAV